MYDLDKCKEYIESLGYEVGEDYIFIAGNEYTSGFDIIHLKEIVTFMNLYYVLEDDDMEFAPNVDEDVFLDILYKNKEKLQVEEE